MNKTVFVVVVFMFSQLISFSQSDTTLTLETIDFVEETHRSLPIGNDIQNYSLDENFLEGSSSLDELLANEGIAYIKNNGPSSLSLSSIRGGTGGHTLVLWNDIPIQSPMLGLLDLSLISSTLFDSFSVIKGSASSGWGSGAVGGVINMKNENKDSEISLESAIGSFGEYCYNGSFNKIVDNWQVGINASHKSARNNFPFSIGDAYPLRIQNNAMLNSTNIMPSIGYKINSQQSILLKYWYQTSNRQIPPLITQIRSEAWQEDESQRWLLEHNWNGKNSILKTKLAHFVERLDYYDPLQVILSESQFASTILDVVWQQAFKSSSWSVGFNQIHNVIETVNYAENKSELRQAIFGSYRYQFGNFISEVGLRQEVSSDGNKPFIPSFSIVYFTDHWSLTGKVAKSYRFPTMNDRYWSVGGNPDLKPESGWTQEVGFLWDKESFKINFNSFNRIMNDWIQWAPEDGSFFYSAKNLFKVWSRGIETRVEWDREFGPLLFKLMTSYQYTRSSSLETISRPAIKKGAQLWYVPTHLAGMGLSMQVNDFGMRYMHHYTDEVVGLNENVSSFDLGNLTLNYKMSMFDDLQCELYMRANNLWNEDYFIVERSPMPRRNYRLGIKLKY